MPQAIAVQQQDGCQDAIRLFLHEPAQTMKYFGERIPFRQHLKDQLLPGKQGFCPLSVRNVDIGTDIAREFSAPGVSRNATFDDPAIFSIRTPEPVFHPERFSGVEGRQEAIETALHIVWMHSFRPSCAHFLLHGSASEIEPRFVEVVAKAIRSGHPNQDRRLIGHYLKASFAFTKLLFGALLLRDVAIYGVIHDLFPGSRCDRNREKGYVDLSAVLSFSNGLDRDPATLLELKGVFSGTLRSFTGCCRTSWGSYPNRRVNSWLTRTMRSSVLRTARASGACLNNSSKREVCVSTSSRARFSSSMSVFVPYHRTIRPSDSRKGT